MTILIRNMGYLFIWGMITLISSYNDIVNQLSFQPILNWNRDYNMAIIPLIIWMIAYFADFIYEVFHRNPMEIISIKSVKIGSIALGFFFLSLVIVLAQTSYLNEHALDLTENTTNLNNLTIDIRQTIRFIGLLSMFGFILLFKWGSLNSIQIKEQLQKA